MKVLVCPLDWGLGHAARCIPLIRALRACGHQVRVGASGGGLRLLRSEFPGLDSFEFPGYPVHYSRSPALFLPVMLFQMPRMLLGMLAESRRLRLILSESPCDLVISDGRYGVHSAAVPTVFITHQIFIRMPARFPGAGFLERRLLALNLRLLRRFDRVWVPDFPGPDSLSGELSHRPCDLANLEFIGPLSRFPEPPGEREEGASGREPFPEVDILAVVSGPEPQRSLFEVALRKQLGTMPGTRVLVRGLPGGTEAVTAETGTTFSIRPGALNEVPHLPGRDLSRLFAAADLIVARSGYTTLMELAALGTRAAVLVPTPGQSEQEYLADHLEAAGAAIRMDQHVLDLETARERLRGRAGFARWSRAEGGGHGKKSSLADFLVHHALMRGSGSSGAGLKVQKNGQQ